jgi:hypothetical protein
MKLAAALGKAIDSCAPVLARAGFERLVKSDGMSLRRFVRTTDQSQAEVSVYRDKWWSSEGGTIRAEAFCLVHDYQRALSGFLQDWMKPDYSRPLHHFQYGLGRNVVPFQEQITSPDDCERLGRALLEWLIARALPWALELEQPSGVEAHLERERGFSNLAIYLANLGHFERAQASLARFMATLPRDIEGKLEQFSQCGLIPASDAESLRLASLQSNRDYEHAVQSWLALQKSGCA